MEIKVSGKELDIIISSLRQSIATMRSLWSSKGADMPAANNEEIAKDIAYTGLDFGNWIDKVEFIAVVGGEYGMGKILKYFE